jgi:diguanylate cyclase (GGDEF)-like protein
MPMPRAKFASSFHTTLDLNRMDPVPAQLPPERLLEIIRTQTEIARLDLDLGNVMALVAERAQTLAGGDGAVVELAEGEEMVYRASAGLAAAQLGLRLKRVGSLSGLCVAQGEVLRCDDSDTDPRVDREACRKVGLRSMIVAPLSHNGNVVGVLKVMSAAAAAFGDAEVHILQLMSGLIAAAMYNAARYETSELFYRATHDPLTGLANRALFYDRLRHQLARAQREATRFAVLNLDMDGLKPINDQFGHRAGDAAIQALAERIKSTSREADTVARVGGDEFACLIANVNDRDEVQAAAERIDQAIGAPFEFERRPLRIGASIGSAVFPEDGLEPDFLIEQADQAMYRSKRQRKGEKTR